MLHGQVPVFQPIGKKVNSTTKNNKLQNRAKYYLLLLMECIGLNVFE